MQRSLPDELNEGFVIHLQPTVVLLNSLFPSPLHPSSITLRTIAVRRHRASGEHRASLGNQILRPRRGRAGSTCVE